MATFTHPINGLTCLLSCLLFPSICQSTPSATDFNTLALRCAPSVSVDTLKALVKSQSNFNPYHLEVLHGDSGKNEPAPTTRAESTSFIEAMQSMAILTEAGQDFRIGLTGINQKLTTKYGVKPEQLLDGCTNLAVASVILGQCFSQTQKTQSNTSRVTQALACFALENGQTGYALSYAQQLTGELPFSVPSFKKPSEPLSQSPKEKKAFVF